jgi:hypothetical protein
MKIPTFSCLPHVKALAEFKCHGNLFSRWETASDGSRMYVVYSYGPHWPLFVWHDGVWYENKDRYSVTTSKHRSQAHPRCDTVKVLGLALRTFILHGIEHLPGVQRLLAVSAG